jgi:hypothetical protein
MSRAKCTMVSGRIEGSKALGELPKWQEGMKTPAIGVFVGDRADSCAKMPFINQNKPCNLPDYSGTKHHHSYFKERGTDGISQGTSRPHSFSG